MRSTQLGRTQWGFLLVACLVVLVGWSVNRTEVLAQRPGAAALPAQATTASADSILSHSVEMADGRQQITVIDARTRSMAVYQVDARSGAIALKSVRNMNWDLQMDEFNSGDKPSPKEIRSLLEQR